MSDVLTARDRCDSCGSAAYVRILLEAAGGVVDLCSHDYRKHEAAIIATPGLIRVIDERHRLDAAEGKRVREGVS